LGILWIFVKNLAQIRQNLEKGNEYVNNPHDVVKERFLQLEAQFEDISYNVNLLMLALINMLSLFKEDGSSNAEDRSEGRSQDWEETKNEPNKGPEKDQPSWSAMNH